MYNYPAFYNSQILASKPQRLASIDSLAFAVKKMFTRDHL